MSTLFKLLSFILMAYGANVGLTDSIFGAYFFILLAIYFLMVSISERKNDNGK